MAAATEVAWSALTSGATSFGSGAGASVGPGAGGVVSSGVAVGEGDGDGVADGGLVGMGDGVPPGVWGRGVGVAAGEPGVAAAWTRSARAVQRLALRFWTQAMRL